MTECIFEWTRTVVSRRFLDTVPAKTDDEKYELIREIALIAMVNLNHVGDELTLEGSWENLVKIQPMLITLPRLQDNTVVAEDCLKEGNIILENQLRLEHQETVAFDSQKSPCCNSSEEETERMGRENEVYVNITVSRQFAKDGDLGSLNNLISTPNSSLENIEVTQAASEVNVSQKMRLCDWNVRKVSKGSDNTSNSTLSKSLPPVKRYEKKKDYEKLAPFKFFCSLCSFKTKRESHFQRHMKLHSRVSELFSCTRCDFTTIRLGHLRRHETTHSDTKFHCNKCSYSTDHHSFLIRHQRIKHVSAKRSEKVTPKEVLSCTECAYTTTRTYLHQRHMQAHARSGSSLNLRDNNQYHCNQCSYRTGRKEHFVRHLNSVHVNKRPYLCDHCGKAFKRTDALKQHRITHAGELAIATPYHCPVCAKKCRSQAQLTQHMAVHSNVRAFLCEICGSSFKTRAVQQKHVMTIHKNPKAFSCSHCSRRFNTQYALRRHTKQHSNEEKQQKQIDDQEKNEMDGVQQDGVLQDGVLENAVLQDGVLQLLQGEPILIEEIPASQIGDGETPAAITVQVVGFVQPYTGDS